MQAVRRSAVAWYVAALVPLSLLAILYLAIILQQTWREAEDKALDRARGYIAEVDARLQHDFGALALLTRSRRLFARSGDDEAWFAKLREDFPQWRILALTDLASKTTAPIVGKPAAETVALGAESLDFAMGGLDQKLTGVDAKHFGCLCIAIYKKLNLDGAAFVLTLVRETTDFHESLAAQTHSAEVAALVDRDGRFVARSLDNAIRAGTPASVYVRAAIARGGEGVYTGVTLEGLNNRTAYAVSRFTGWSAHIAVPAASYRLLSAGYVLFALVAVGVALAFAGGVTWFGLRDLHLARLRERARLQSYKLEAVGALSSAIVHDFNNLLSIMNACLKILSSSPSAEKRDYAAREGFLASDRAAKLVNQLLAFVRDKPLDIACVDLAAAVEDIRDLISRSLTSAIRFEAEIAPDARYVRTNRSQLELVLLNFATNARDALPGGGAFTIFSRRSSEPDRVDLVIRDDGPGMSTEVAARAFEPFFTTKPEGKGTGLGLAQAQLLATDSDATLTLVTAPGKGCAFTYSFRACMPEDQAKLRN